MLFLLAKRLPSSFPVLAIVAANLVISMPAAPAKSSPTAPSDSRNGFSIVPKILEIQLPLKIAGKEDLIAWAKYVMGLMASKINVTLATIREPSTKNSEPIKIPKTFGNVAGVQPFKNSKNSAYKIAEGNGGLKNDVRQFVNSENSRYAENIRNLNGKLPSTLRILENARHLEDVRILGKNGDVPFSTPRAITISGVTANNLFHDRHVETFGNFGIPKPLEISGNIQIPRTRIERPVFDGRFDTDPSIKVVQQPLFVPQFPNFGPTIDVKNDDVFRNDDAVSPPTRQYLPVTTDNVRFPSDPYITRYFFDGVERNAPGNLRLSPSDIAFTTGNPLIFADERRILDSVSSRKNLTVVKPLFKVPFEAVITFTRDGSDQATTGKFREENDHFAEPSRNPSVQFPFNYDSNYTRTKESGQINVVFEDDETENGTKLDERRKKEKKKKESSKKQKAKKQKTSARLQSPISEFLKNYAALRRNNTPAESLSPPPVNQGSTTQRIPTRQRIPSAQGAPQPQRTQQYYPPRKPPSRIKQGRRNQTSLARINEDDEDSGSEEDNEENNDNENGTESGEDSGDKSKEGSNSEENNSEENNAKDDVESAEGEDSNEGSSSESEYDDSDEDEGGSIQAIIELLQLAAPIIEDLSDPESDTSLAEVLETAIPLLQDLSEGEGALDLPGLLLPLLMEISGGADGMGDSAAILTPLIQLSAPLSGPLSGPLIVPLSRQSSNPPGQGGSSIGGLLKASLDPLLQPIGPGKKMTVLSNLIAGVISGLSKNLGGKSDIMSLVKAVVAGTIAGTSAGSSGGPKDSYGAPTSYGGDYGGNGAPAGYGYNKVPSQGSNPLSLIGGSIKDVLNSIIKVVASLLNAITSILGASSNSSNTPSPVYGPPSPVYGPPSSTTPLLPPPPKSYMVPPKMPNSMTTNKPERVSRF